MFETYNERVLEDMRAKRLKTDELEQHRDFVIDALHDAITLRVRRAPVRQMSYIVGALGSAMLGAANVTDALLSTGRFSAAQHIAFTISSGSASTYAVRQAVNTRKEIAALKQFYAELEGTAAGATV